MGRGKMNKYTTSRAKSQKKVPVITQKTCCDCYWLRSTKCIDVHECLVNEAGEKRLVPKFFKQKETNYMKSRGREYKKKSKGLE